MRGGAGAVGAAAGGDPAGGAVREDDAVFDVVGGVIAGCYGEDGAAVVRVDAVDDVAHCKDGGEPVSRTDKA